MQMSHTLASIRPFPTSRYHFGYPAICREPSHQLRIATRRLLQRCARPFHLEWFKKFLIDGNGVSSVRPRCLRPICFRRIALFSSKTLRTFSSSYSVIRISDVFSAIRHLHHLDSIHLRCFTSLPSDGVEHNKAEASPSCRGTLTLASYLSYEPFVTEVFRRTTLLLFEFRGHTG